MDSTAPSASRSRTNPAVSSRIMAYSPLLMGWSKGSTSTQGGRNRSICFSGNSWSTARMISLTAPSSRVRQLAAKQVTS